MPTPEQSEQRVTKRIRVANSAVADTTILDDVDRAISLASLHFLDSMYDTMSEFGIDKADSEVLDQMVCGTLFLELIESTFDHFIDETEALHESVPSFVDLDWVDEDLEAWCDKVRLKLG